MSDPSTLTIAISQASLGLSDYVMTGHDNPARQLSVANYREPAMQPRITYAPTGDLHGDTPLSWSYQETLITFNVFDEVGTSESTMRAKIAALVVALGRLHFTVTITINSVVEVWSCRAGSLVPADDRDSTDMQNHRPLWTVSIPAYPVRS